MSGLFAFTKIPMYIKCPGHFRVAEDGSMSYVAAALKKMTILVPGLIYVEYSDVANIIPQPTAAETNKSHEGPSHEPYITKTGCSNNFSAGITLDQLQNSSFLKNNKPLPTMLINRRDQKQKTEIIGTNSYPSKGQPKTV